MVVLAASLVCSTLATATLSSVGRLAHFTQKLLGKILLRLPGQNELVAIVACREAGYGLAPGADELLL